MGNSQIIPRETRLINVKESVDRDRREQNITITDNQNIMMTFKPEEIDILTSPVDPVCITWNDVVLEYMPVYNLQQTDDVWIDTLSMVMLKKFNRFKLK